MVVVIDQVMPKIIIFPEDNDDWTSFFMELHNSNTHHSVPEIL